LTTLPPELDGAIAAAGTRLGRLGRRFEYFQTSGSTNDVASERSANGDHEGVVFVADAQTSGRGRRGRTWFTAWRRSLCLHRSCAGAFARPGTRDAADDAGGRRRAVEGVRAATGRARLEVAQRSLRWPPPLAGILAEGAGDAVVLGYGINVLSAACPELADRVTALESELGRAVDRGSVFAETLCALARRYDDLLEARFDAILDAWRALAPSAEGARVTLPNEQSGVTAGIDDRGALLVRIGDRIERIVAGELSWE
jgi:BirA family biotin operon repressor/biotin-[acetyl-CoA-carboxylase] ligase